MLHITILPQEDRWRRFFRQLRFVVVDELHIYSGLFGCHVAFVMRRCAVAAESDRVCVRRVDQCFVTTQAEADLRGGGKPSRSVRFLFGDDRQPGRAHADHLWRRRRLADR